MKGLWKESLKGWHKDYRRKSQKRKHSIRDNGKVIIKKEDPKNFRYEVEMDITYKGSRYFNKEIVYDADVFKATVCYHIGESFEVIDLFLYKDNNKYYYYEKDYFVEGKDIKLGYYIESLGGTNLEIYNIRKTSRVIKLDVESEIAKRNKVTTAKFLCDNIFLYNKPLLDYQWNRMYTNKRKKYAKRLANRSTRYHIKQWINNGIIDKEVKTNAISKSIAWEIS